MRDVQGVQRGKCTLCECREYTAPSTPGKVRCEYCNHTPRDHIRIDNPGKCNKCGCCDEYYSEDTHSFTDCQYCGCAASDHNVRIQADHGLKTLSGHHGIRKPQLMGPPTDSSSSCAHQQAHYQSSQSRRPRPSTEESTPGSHVPQEGTQPVIQQYGNCIYPGCPFQKYVDREEGKIHDFCSKSCAKNFAEMQASFHQYKISQQQIGPAGHGSSGVQQSSTLRHIQSGAPLLISQPIRPPAGGPHSSSTSAQSRGHQGGSSKMCTKCGRNLANPGRGWCQQCYVSSKS